MAAMSLCSQTKASMMANDFLKNMPPALKSLWQLENELRRALQNAVLLRRADANENLERARTHIAAALRAVHGETVQPDESAQRKRSKTA
jgi:fructose-bisphosphate aldolase class 1